MRCLCSTFHQLSVEGLSFAFCTAAQYLPCVLLRKLHVYLKRPESSPNAFQPLCSHSDPPLGFAWNSAILRLRIGMPQGKMAKEESSCLWSSLHPLAVFSVACRRLPHLSGFSSWPVEVELLPVSSSVYPRAVSPRSWISPDFSTSVWQLKKVHFLYLGVYVSVDF